MDLTMKIFLTAFAIVFTEAAPKRTVPPGTCISDCKGLPNGDYQSCRACSVYASCVAGAIFDNRPCPSGLVWDDNLKRCEYTSSTCFDDVTAEPVTEEEEECIASCQGVSDGDYQSCVGCRVYASCVGGHLIDNRPCPAGLFWDDNNKKCLYESSTCLEITQDENLVDCVSSCTGRADGNYQSCEGCDVSISCVGGLVAEKRLCPQPMFWDDNVKTCVHESSTCKE